MPAVFSGSRSIRSTRITMRIQRKVMQLSFRIFLSGGRFRHFGNKQIKLIQEIQKFVLSIHTAQISTIYISTSLDIMSDDNEDNPLDFPDSLTLKSSKATKVYMCYDFK